MPSGIPTNRTNTSLPTEVAQEILQKTQEGSAIMRLAQRVALPGRGLTFPMITGDPEAQWVDETAQKPVSNPTLSTKTMKGYTLAVIVPFSNQFRRDARALYDALVARLPGALSLKYDQTVAGNSAPGSGFDTLGACTAQSIYPSGGNTAYKGLVAAFSDISDEGGVMNGLALAPAAESILLGSVDGTGRPLFNAISDSQVSPILGARVVRARGVYAAGTAGEGTDPGTPAVVGIAGDWTRAKYGIVDGDVKISISEEATLTVGTSQINLWQSNMFAVRAEIEVGFIAETGYFNLLTGATPS